MPSYYHAPKAGPDPEALKRAFLKCGELATAGGHKAINLAVPAKGNVQGIIEDLLGEAATRVLVRDNELPFGVITLYLVTKRVALSHPGPVLAAWTSIDQIKELARSHRTAGLVYLPWLDEELAEFTKIYPGAGVI